MGRSERPPIPRPNAKTRTCKLRAACHSGLHSAITPRFRTSFRNWSELGSGMASNRRVRRAPYMDNLCQRERRFTYVRSINYGPSGVPRGPPETESLCSRCIHPNAKREPKPPFGGHRYRMNQSGIFLRRRTTAPTRPSPASSIA